MVSVITWNSVPGFHIITSFHIITDLSSAVFGEVMLKLASSLLQHHPLHIHYPSTIPTLAYSSMSVNSWNPCWLSSGLEYIWSSQLLKACPTLPELALKSFHIYHALMGADETWWGLAFRRIQLDKSQEKTNFHKKITKKTNHCASCMHSYQSVGEQVPWTGCCWGMTIFFSFFFRLFLGLSLLCFEWLLLVAYCENKLLKPLGCLS